MRLVTIDLGGTDVLELGYEKGRAQIQQHLPAVLAALRAAAGPDAPIVGINYYNPFVVVWFDDTALAHALVDVGVQSNNDLEAIYTAAGLAVADVEAAFSTTDFTIQPDGLPLNVQRLCQWTLMCAFGDPHPNQEGSGVIAHAFEDVPPDD